MCATNTNIEGGQPANETEIAWLSVVTSRSSSEVTHESCLYQYRTTRPFEWKYFCKLVREEQEMQRPLNGIFSKKRQRQHVPYVRGIPDSPRSVRKRASQRRPITRPAGCVPAPAGRTRSGIPRNKRFGVGVPMLSLCAYGTFK